MKRSRLDLKFKSAHIRYQDQVFKIEVTPDIAVLTSGLIFRAKPVTNYKILRHNYI